MEKLKGRIVKIEKYSNSAIYIKQGIKKEDQYRYSSYPGGNGTYVTGGEYMGTSLIVKIYIFDLKKSFEFDVYEEIRKITGKKRISAKMLATITSHQGDKVDVVVDDCHVHFDPGILLQ